MLEPVKALTLQLLAVPPEPSLPAGSAATARVFRASRRYLNLKLLRWGAGQAATLIGLIFALAIFDLAAFGAELAVSRLPFRALAPIAVTVFEWIEAFGVIAFVVQLPFTLIPIILDWELRWYIVTDRSLRIREGVWKVSELTMTFANVQEVSIQQGPLDRLFGVASVRVRSAGGGASSSSHDREREEKSGHIGYFRGVDGAPAIRDLILDRLKRQRDAGIGDGETVHEPSTSSGHVPSSPETLEAARELLAEAKALRQSVVHQPGVD
jgi:membrane protein YdbS with pleckstrin-like domain